MRRYFLTFFVTLFCATSVYASEDKAIKHALLKYNYGIIKMAKSGETDFFKSFVKEDVVMKLMVWVESWQDNNLVMLADINDFVFGPILYNEDNASITTMENWDFSYINIATREMALDPVNMLYKMRYTLKKQDEGWMIVDIKHLEEKQFTKPNSHTPSLNTKQKKPAEDFTFSEP